ncbi:IS630 family transposase [Streptomyces violaceus]|uniref:IS630 family transposase n=1 Tax=Streptomyces violaceus TaxID=1936 RepID=UPI00399D69A7
MLLSDDERAVLARWTRRASSAQALALRARIVLACAGPEVPPIVVVARELRVAADTVRKWRRRFLADRLDGLVDEPRPGRPPTISVDQVEAVVVTTLEQLPQNATHWSRKSMADRSGLSKSTVGRIWRKFQLKPHLTDTFKLSTDPLFVEKVYDVVGLYFNPPEGAVVLSVDEKSQIQAMDRSQPVLPMMPGMPERRTHDDVRNGLTTLFAAFDVATGEVISALHRRHRAAEFKKFLIRIDKEVPAHLAVHRRQPHRRGRGRRLRLRRQRLTRTDRTPGPAGAWRARRAASATDRETTWPNRLDSAPRTARISKRYRTRR